jgi:hypothetical protein
LKRREFDRLMARNTCSRWQGEYPGEPFGWSALSLVGKRVRTRIPMDTRFGAPLKGGGVVIRLDDGAVSVRWDVGSRSGNFDTWLCKFCFDKFCEEQWQ